MAEPVSNADELPFDATGPVAHTASDDDLMAQYYARWAAVDAGLPNANARAAVALARELAAACVAAELEPIRATLASTFNPEDAQYYNDADELRGDEAMRWVMLNENGDPIIEARTDAEAVAGIVRVMDAVHVALDKAENHAHLTNRKLAAAEAERDALRAEVERLREVLRRVAECKDVRVRVDISDKTAKEAPIGYLHQFIARAALAQEAP